MKQFVFPLLFLLSFMSMQAQNGSRPSSHVIYSENFDNGIPSDWQVVHASNFNIY